jgi:hypothetical protein
MLKEALKCARRAVKLDSATKDSSTSSKLGSDSVRPDLTAAVAAYDEAIAILQRVIARRSQKPGITGEVERVTDIVSQTPPFFFVIGADSQGTVNLLFSRGRHHPLFFVLFCSCLAA